jgi:hypothetical protein
MRGAMGRVRERMYKVITESVPLTNGHPNGHGNGHGHDGQNGQDEGSQPDAGQGTSAGGPLLAAGSDQHSEDDER